LKKITPIKKLKVRGDDVVVEDLGKQVRVEKLVLSSLDGVYFCGNFWIILGLLDLVYINCVIDRMLG
jgi:hypothetical protein